MHCTVTLNSFPHKQPVSSARRSPLPMRVHALCGRYMALELPKDSLAPCVLPVIAGPLMHVHSPARLEGSSLSLCAKPGCPPPHPARSTPPLYGPSCCSACTCPYHFPPDHDVLAASGGCTHCQVGVNSALLRGKMCTSLGQDCLTTRPR